MARLTVNLCLHKSHDTEGTFCCPNVNLIKKRGPLFSFIPLASIVVLSFITSIICAAGSGVFFFGETQDPVAPTEVLARIEHAVGTVIIHDGNQWHQTEPIRCGTRDSLILWFD